MKSPAIILLFILLYTSGYSQRPSVEEALKNMANVQMPHIQTSPDMTKYELAGTNRTVISKRGIAKMKEYVNVFEKRIEHIFRRS